jgi:AcrR family transcriptional regulator
MTDQSVSARKRDSILNAARAVFSREGYAGTAVDDIAEQAGIAKGTLYLYFKSKEDVYLAALARDIRELAERARVEMDRQPGFREKLSSFIRVRLEFARAHEDFLRIYLAEYGGMFIKAPLRKELCNLTRENMRYMASIVQEAVDRGEIREVPAAAFAGTIFDTARGLIERRLLGWKEFKVPDEIEFAVDLLWRGIERKSKPIKKS